jgi:murein DD-endopeptidase MepM/ murein hydrolase activator NlpD
MANGEVDYFHEDGKSARRFLMKTPVDGARLSSSFGPRKHPVLGYNKIHKGTDFAAPTGTPIMAAGSGVIERADWYGSFGRYVRIRHNGSYETAYAHMSAFAKGIKKGARVKQGQIIGYIGTTGRSTGPHLHYEVHFNGGQVNSQTLKVPTGKTLEGQDKTRFMAMLEPLQQRIASTPMSTSVASANTQ